MRNRVAVFTFLFILFTSPLALASYCQLNIRGDSICLGESALLKVNRPDPNEDRFKLIVVEEINYPQVIVKNNGYTDSYSVDDLIGRQICAGENPVCEKDRVSLNERCPLESRWQNYRVIKVFRNNLIEIEERRSSRFYAPASYLIPLVCVDSVI